jgi:quinol monooxygenase YgiN
MIIVIATIHTQPGKAPDVISGARACIDGTRREDGCISYDYVQDTERADVVMVIERWTSREALAAHFHVPHLNEWRERRKPWVKSVKVEIIQAGEIEIL